jgi:hypothetical protein
VAASAEHSYTAAQSACFGEGFMKTSKMAVIVALATAALVTGASAQVSTTTTKKKTGKPVAAYVRPPTRITVRRPFTDPGTETLPLAEHYHDYAFSPTYTPFPSQGGIVGFWRAPLPSPIDLPGYNYWTH